ncbi:MAG: hypothetical protein WCD30_14535, partial [Pseudolabrys sp.]
MRQAYSSRPSLAMAAEKMKPRTIVRGFRTYLSGIGDLLLALLLLTRLLLAALLLLATLTRLRLAALLLLTGFLLAALLATLLLLAGLLVWILIHRSFLSNIGSPLRSLVFHGKSQSAANAFVPRFTLRQCVWNLSPRVEFPFATRRTD